MNTRKSYTTHSAHRDTPFRGAIINVALRTLKSLARTFGIDVTRYEPAKPSDELLNALRSFANLRDASLSACDEEEIRFLEFCGTHWRNSRSQIFQDLFVQFELREKYGGYFVEFGAADGVYLSNSFALESFYNWTGILSEPARCWHNALKENRTCRIDLRCVWDKSEQDIGFFEAEAAELSTINDFLNADMHAKSRRQSQLYKVKTVALNDMLRESGAPREIDYMSVDTEGSEFKILSAFDFVGYEVKVITVEHNYGSERKNLYDLLTRNGFRRKFEMFSQWDDWYVRS